MNLGITKRAAITPAISNTTNLAGGTAFAVDNAAQRLIHIVGAPGFNEPKAYYNVPESPDLARKFKGSLDGLTGQAKEIVGAAVDVARSATPKDLLAIAAWLRKEGHCRQTPLVLLAVAASEIKTRPFVRQYAPKVIQRADELAGAYAAYRYLFGKPIPAALLKGIKDAFGNFKEYHLLKYMNESKSPSMKDVLLQMPDRKPGKPVSRGVAEYLLNGTLVDRNGKDHSDSAPLFAAYVGFLKAAGDSKEFTPEIAAAADKAKVDWEVLVSMFGNNKATWSNVLPRMGYMAALRNIRNMLQAGIAPEDLAPVISDRKGVLYSKQFPFRFIAAYREVQQAPGISEAGRRKLLDAIAIALDISVENVGKVPGTTLTIVDCSGSMGHPLSDKSTMSIKDAASALAGIFHKACETSYVIAFGTTAQVLEARSNDSAYTIIDKLSVANVGGSTIAHRALDLAIEKGLKADRIVLLSDMQCYSDHRAGGNLEASLEKYRVRLNRSVWFHSVNLNSPDSSAQVAPGPRVNLVSGFSDKIMGRLMDAEGAKGPEIPTMKYIRDNY
jgi:60 kDa SS-A/Ro ribonucleoprotein